MPAMRPFLALYVEGLCSESAFYRFLCFFKILDKLLSFVNPRLQNLCRKYSLERPDLNGIVPKDPFDSIAPEYVGMKYTALRDSLQGQYRNAIAHIDLSSDIHPFNADAEAAVARAAMTLAFAANDLLGRTYDVLIKMGANGIDVVDLNARPDV
jgi:hypothetical protein